MSRPALKVYRTPAEEAQRDAVMAAVADLVRKYEEHKTRKWSEVRHSDGRPFIALSALDAVVDAYRQTETQ